MTRRQILSLAESAIGSKYVWGGDAWDPSDRRALGADCSGLIAKAWQLDGPRQTWEELVVRPTTYSLLQESPQWTRVKLEDRRPGDAFVRHDVVKQHAYIFERDAREKGSDTLILIEAPEPGKLIQRVRLSLRDLVHFSLVRRNDLDDVGIVGRTMKRVLGRFVSAFRSMGGEDEVGQPFDAGQGIYVHGVPETKGLSQDFRNGRVGPGAFYGRQPDADVFPVFGEIFEAYVREGGPTGPWGWPTSFPLVVPGKDGSDVIQAFERRMVVHENGERLLSTAHELWVGGLPERSDGS